MIKEKLKASGRVKITLLDDNKELKSSREINNLIVTSGLNWLVSRATSGTDAVMSHMGLGSGTTAAAAGDTTLETPVDARIALGAAAVTGNSVEYQATFGPGAASGAITEAGIFNSGTVGTMLARVVFPVVNKEALDTMIITWTVTINAV